MFDKMLNGADNASIGSANTGAKMNDYNSKTAAELHYIIKDAGEAARAMRGFDEKAEAKYLDQMNDACTELNRRRQG